MASITDAELKTAARLLGLKIFQLPKKTARFGFTELQAVIQKIDDTFTGNANLLDGTKSLEVNFVTEINSVNLGDGTANLSVEEKSIAIQVWAEVKHGSEVVV